MPIPEETTFRHQEYQLRLTQAYLEKEEDEGVGQQFLSLLAQLKAHYDPKSEITTFFSYAWPTDENLESEYWIQGFLKILSNHLNKVAITAFIDTKDSQPGSRTYAHMDRINTSNHVVLFCTPSLRYKDTDVNRVDYLVRVELNYMLDVINKSPNKVKPYVLKGNYDMSYPPAIQRYVSGDPIYNLGYFVFFKNMIKKYYNIGTSEEKSKFFKQWELSFRALEVTVNNEIESQLSENSLNAREKLISSFEDELPAFTNTQTWRKFKSVQEASKLVQDTSSNSEHQISKDPEVYLKEATILLNQAGTDLTKLIAAKELGLQAVESSHQREDNQLKPLLESLFVLARCSLLLNDLDTALNYCKEIIKIRTADKDSNSVGEYTYAFYLHFYAQLLSKNEEFAESYGQHQKALAMYKSTLRSKDAYQKEIKAITAEMKACQKLIEVAPSKEASLVVLKM